LPLRSGGICLPAPSSDHQPKTSLSRIPSCLHVFMSSCLRASLQNHAHIASMTKNSTFDLRPSTFDLDASEPKLLKKSFTFFRHLLDLNHRPIPLSHQ
jgi:hypothetical protein